MRGPWDAAEPGGPPPRGPRRGWAVAGLSVLGLWTVLLVAAANTATWLTAQVLLALDMNLPAAAWLAPAGAPLLLAGVPALLVARLSRWPFARAAGRGWAAALLLGGLLATARLVPPTAQEAYLAVLALLALLLSVRRRRARTGPDDGTPGRDGRPGGARWRVPAALAAGTAVLVPWLWAGALGGVVESVLAAAAALAVGRLAADPVRTLLGAAAGLGGRWGRTAVGGLLAGVGLAALVAGAGEPGQQLYALLAVPPLAFLLAVPARPAPLPVAPVVGLALLGPLAFADVEDSSLLLGTGDVLRWAGTAALLALAAALVLAPPAVLALGRTPRTAVAAGLAVLSAGAGTAVHLTTGRPGFFGDRVFVVLREQADLAGLDRIADRDRRLRATYDRLVAVARRSQAPLLAALRGKGLRATPYYLVNGVEVHAGPWLLPWLDRRAEVDRVLPAPVLRPIPRPAAPVRGGQAAPAAPAWNLTTVGAPRVWREFGTGTGIVVGASDSGVDGTHPALRATFRGGDDSWLDPSGARTPVDHQGHGTHTTATAVGAGVGVAPGARWTGCVNLPRNLGSLPGYLTCLQFMLAPYPAGADPLRDGRPERAPHVLTNSWGCPQVEGCDPGSLRPATAALAAAGVYVVVSAGNTGPRCGSVTAAPAADPAVLTVGAVDAAGRVTGFSSRGPGPDGRVKPDLLAPGADVLSARPGGGYGPDSGTSMAAPHVAGTVALMWSANPRLVGDLARTTAILRATARPATVPAGAGCTPPEQVTGSGVVDAYAAVRAARAAR